MYVLANGDSPLARMGLSSHMATTRLEVVGFDKNMASGSCWRLGLNAEKDACFPASGVARL